MKRHLLWLGGATAASFLAFYLVDSDEMAISACFGLLIPILLGAIIINSITKSWSNVVSTVLIAIGVFVGLGLAIELGKLKELNPQMVNAATQVCGGEGLEDAAPYDATLQRIHPIILEGFKRDGYPSGWLPESLDKIELVACWKSLDPTLYGVCTYTGGKVLNRYKHDAEITVREARTGKIISTFTLEGGIPPGCPQTITENFAYDLHGYVSGTEVITSVESFVNP